MTSKRTFIPAMGYDFLTRCYDMTVKLTMPERKFRTKLIDLVAPNNHEAILEFGFGTGQNLIFAHLRNPETELTGLDIDPKIQQIAANKLAR